MIKVRKFKRIAQKKHRSVIADKVPVAAVGIELHGKTAYVALGIGRAALAGNRRKPDQTRSLLAYTGKNRCARIFRNVMCNRKRAECTRAFSMHSTLRYHFAVKMSDFFNIPWVLGGKRPTLTGGLDILVISNRPTVLRSKSFLIHTVRKVIIFRKNMISLTTSMAAKSFIGQRRGARNQSSE